MTFDTPKFRFFCLTLNLFLLIAEFGFSQTVPQNDTLAHIESAVSLAKSGHLQNALEEIDAILTKTPSNPRALRVRGHIYVALKRYDEALKDFDQVISLVPNDSIAYRDRALLHYLMKNQELAMKDIRAARQLTPSQYLNRRLEKKMGRRENLK